MSRRPGDAAGPASNSWRRSGLRSAVVGSGCRTGQQRHSLIGPALYRPLSSPGQTPNTQQQPKTREHTKHTPTHRTGAFSCLLFFNINTLVLRHFITPKIPKYPEAGRDGSAFYLAAIFSHDYEASISHSHCFDS